MSCPSELICNAYVDDALPGSDARALEKHLHTCAACSGLVESLTLERNLLRQALQSATADGVIPDFVPRPTISRLLVWLGWAAIAVWAVSTAWAGLMSSLTLPSWLAWLSPSTIGTSVQFLITTLLPGSSIADLGAGLVSAAQSIVVAMAALFGFGWLVRHQPGRATSPLIAVSALSLLMTAAPESQAFEVRRDDQRVVVAADEVVDDTLFVAAEDIVIDGVVTGDLMVAGESLRIRGRVDGVVFAAGENVALEGEFGSSVFSAGENVSFRSATLAGNLFGAGEKVVVHDDVTINGSSALAGEEVEMHGSVSRDLRAASGRLTVFGSVGGNMQGYGATVELTDTAHIAGDLKVFAETEQSAIIAPGATVVGETEISGWPKEPSRYATPGFYMGEVLQLLAAFVTGLVLFRVLPALGEAELEGGAQALVTAAIGALILIGTPVLAVIAMITLIGFPLGLLTVLLWLVTLYAAGIVIAGYIGRMILPNRESITLPLLLGLTLLVVVTNLPLIGGPIQMVAGLLGLGLIGQWIRELWEARTA